MPAWTQRSNPSRSSSSEISLPRSSCVATELRDKGARPCSVELTPAAHSWGVNYDTTLPRECHQPGGASSSGTSQTGSCGAQEWGPLRTVRSTLMSSGYTPSTVTTGVCTIRRHDAAIGMLGPKALEPSTSSSEAPNRRTSSSPLVSVMAGLERWTA